MKKKTACPVVDGSHQGITDALAVQILGVRGFLPFQPIETGTEFQIAGVQIKTCGVRQIESGLRVFRTSDFVRADGNGEAALRITPQILVNFDRHGVTVWQEPANGAALSIL